MDVQLYRYNGNEWVEINPIPAKHTHPEYFDDSGSYRKILGKSGSGSGYITTPTLGIIPATSGGSGNVGTSGWPFYNVYAKNIFQDGDRVIQGRTAIVKSVGVMDSRALFANSISTTSTAVGMEYNILLNATKKGYTITQSGSGQFSATSLEGLFNGNLVPKGSGSIDPANPLVILIEGLPNIHTQTGGVFGWTSRYWNPLRYKVEAYNSYNNIGWVTWLDHSTIGERTKDLVIPMTTVGGGNYTKIKLTFYEAYDGGGSNIMQLSQIFFIHPEAQKVHEYLDVEWANKGKQLEDGTNFLYKADNYWQLKNQFNIVNIGAYNTNWTNFTTTATDGYSFDKKLSVRGDIRVTDNYTTRLENSTGYIYELGNRVLTSKYLPIKTNHDFTNGTLIKTSIDWNSDEGNPFTLKITGYMYGGKSPVELIVQGYKYAGDIYYTTNGIVLGDTNFSDFWVMIVPDSNNIGRLCFWFSRQYYLQSFHVYCENISSGSQPQVNTVTAVSDEARPTNATKEVNLVAQGRLKNVSFEGHHHTEYFDDIGSSYRGLVSKGSDGYIRTPFYGLLPYESNANGFSDLGSPTWNFNYAYIKTIYEDGTKLTDKYVKQSNEKPLLIRTRETTTNLTSVGSGNATTGNSVSVTKTLRRGDTLMIEVNSNLSYGNIPKIVTVTCGRDTSSPNSTTLHDIASFTVFDGTNLKTFSFTVSFTDNTSTLYFGSKKYVNTSLNSSTNVIDWTTGDYELFVGRVWRI